MSRVLGAVKDDLEMKKKAIDIEQECLEIEQSENPPGSARKTPTKVNTPARVRRHTIENYKAESQKLIAQANAKLAFCIEMRAQIEQYRESRVESSLQGILEGQLIEAVYQKMEEVMDHTDGSLQDALTNVQGDIESLHESSEQIQQHIVDNSAALEVVQTRLRSRDTKPNRERVHDQAAVALEIEEEHLMNSITKLHIQQTNLQVSLAKLKRAETELEKAVSETSNSGDVDKGIYESLKEMAARYTEALTRPSATW